VDLDRNLNLAFGPDDEEDFLAAQDTLLDGVARGRPRCARSKAFRGAVEACEIQPAWFYAAGSGSDR